MSENTRAGRDIPAEYREGEIEGVKVRDLVNHPDERGWLIEIFRQDWLDDKEFYPVMAYVSLTRPGFQRGPHEHHDQADLFCFIGPSNFKMRMWDIRKGSPTYGVVMTLVVGADNPKSVLVPKGVVHAYRNVGTEDGIVTNCPNRLYKGWNYKSPVDEIRHEKEEDTIFRMDD